jgi:hypothetical protein
MAKRSGSMNALTGALWDVGVSLGVGTVSLGVGTVSFGVGTFGAAGESAACTRASPPRAASWIIGGSGPPYGGADRSSCS